VEQALHREMRHGRLTRKDEAFDVETPKIPDQKVGCDDTVLDCRQQVVIDRVPKLNDRDRYAALFGNRRSNAVFKPRMSHDPRSAMEMDDHRPWQAGRLCQADRCRCARYLENGQLAPPLSEVRHQSMFGSKAA
jgi:hypothetical protein